MQFRYARHTKTLKPIIHFYTQILPLKILGRFEAHEGFDGVFIGKKGLDWHLEFTVSNDQAEQAFDAEDFLVFYFENEQRFIAFHQTLTAKGIRSIPNKNPYWNRFGKTYLDPDGHGIILSYKRSTHLANTALNPADIYSQKLHKKQLFTWGDLTHFVQALPYGRNQNRTDLALVLEEEKGTCSSKHAFLKFIAVRNHFTQVKLLLGIYKMSAQNTSGIAKVLDKHQLEYIPEAHCYLMIDGKRYDYTKPDSNIALVEKDLLLERTIDAEDVASFKVLLHKGFLLDWIQSSRIPFTFHEIWAIREDCIAVLEG